MVNPIQSGGSASLPPNSYTLLAQPTDPESLRQLNIAANGPLPTFDSSHETTPEDLWKTIYSLITRKILDDCRVQQDRLKDALR